jgi:two-component system, chemotaxis family, response regulator PixG
MSDLRIGALFILALYEGLGTGEDMTSEITSMTKITHDLLVLYQQRATGELVIMQSHSAPSDPAVGDSTPHHAAPPTPQRPQWRLYFYLGRLVYATGGIHPVRRWYRALQQHCPAVLTSGWMARAKSSESLWEVDLLNQLVSQNIITSAQAKSIIQSIVQEVMFAVVEQRFVKVNWRSGIKIPQHTVFLSVEQVIQQAQEQRNAWRGSGLGYLQELMSHFSPELAPLLKNPPQLASQVSHGTYQAMLKLLQGKLTLWDLTWQMRRPLAEVIRVLLPFIQQGVIELKTIGDFSSPYVAGAASIASSLEPSAAHKPLIACIDDSPAIGKTLESILVPQGYEVLTIINPLQGIAVLLDRKPDLIFLDLIMPNTNGYELCTFLRKTTTFQNTPIIILTGNDGVVDRVRAKLTGASEFLGKPPDPIKVMQTVHKHLGTTAPVPLAIA